MRRVLAALIGAVRIALGTLDLDDIGAEVGEHHPGARTGDEGALLERPECLRVSRSMASVRASLSLGLKPGGHSPS